MHKWFWLSIGLFEATQGTPVPVPDVSGWKRACSRGLGLFGRLLPQGLGEACAWRRNSLLARHHARRFRKLLAQQQNNKSLTLKVLFSIHMDCVAVLQGMLSVIFRTRPCLWHGQKIRRPSPCIRSAARKITPYNSPPRGNQLIVFTNSIPC